MRSLLLVLLTSLLLIPTSGNTALTDETSEGLSNLKNYQVNTPIMVSSGLPNRAHFEALKANGITNVIDLLPGDRSKERKSSYGGIGVAIPKYRCGMGESNARKF